MADSDPNVIYVGTGAACIRGDASTGNDVYRSSDAGDSWSHVGLPDTRAESNQDPIDFPPKLDNQAPRSAVAIVGMSPTADPGLEASGWPPRAIRPAQGQEL